MFQQTLIRSQDTIYKLQLDLVADFKFELLPLHSPLLRQSLLVSFPPLIDMLKFSGYPYLIRGQPGKKQVANKCVGGRRPGLRSGRRSPIRSRTGRGAAAAFRARPPGEGDGGPTHKPCLRAAMTLGQACPPEYQGAQCAFKDSMIH